MSDSGFHRLKNLRSATEVPAQTRALLTWQCTAALRSAERYFIEQIKADRPALQRGLAANVKILLEDAFSNFQKLTHMNVRDCSITSANLVYAHTQVLNH